MSHWGSYVRSEGAPISVTVHNIWKNDVLGLEVELWAGDRAVQGSNLLASAVVDTLRAFGERTVDFTVLGLNGNVTVFARIDPDDVVPERAENNNVAFRRFLGLPYEGNFPTRLSYLGTRSVTIGDVSSAAGKEVLVVGLYDLQCFESGDTTAAWSYSTGGLPNFIKNTSVVGHVYKSSSSYVVLESGSPSSVRILNGASGAIVKTRFVGDSQTLSDGNIAKWLLTDLGSDDYLT
jgi:hypothetical protein